LPELSQSASAQIYVVNTQENAALGTNTYSASSSRCRRDRKSRARLMFAASGEVSTMAG
jgi:hypothetical protein